MCMIIYGMIRVQVLIEKNLTTISQSPGTTLDQRYYYLSFTAHRPPSLTLSTIYISTPTLAIAQNLIQLNKIKNNMKKKGTELRSLQAPTIGFDVLPLHHAGLLLFGEPKLYT